MSDLEFTFVFLEEIQLLVQQMTTFRQFSAADVLVDSIGLETAAGCVVNEQDDSIDWF